MKHCKNVRRRRRRLIVSDEAGGLQPQDDGPLLVD